MSYCFKHDTIKVILKSGKEVCPRCEVEAGRATLVGAARRTARILER